MWAAGLSLVLVAVLVVVLTRDGRHDVEPAEVDVPRASPADASRALDSFVATIGGGGDPAGSGDLAEVLARNVDEIGLRALRVRYVDQVGTVAPDGTWSGVVELQWQVDRLDAAPSRADVVVTFAPTDRGLEVTAVRREEAGSTRLPVWLQGEVSVARAPGVLVLAVGTAGQAREVAQRVRRGADVVRRVLPDWSGEVVVEVPAGAGGLDDALGATPGTYAGIAAVTATPGSEAGPDAPVHVFVNPDVSDRLRSAGAQVVMSHELVHVATDAVRSGVEPWLLEGFADFVALRDTRLPDTTTLGRAIEAARRGGVPRRLPSAADFDTGAEDLQARYEEAWLACRVVAGRLGEDGLVQLYLAVSEGQDVAAALRRAGLPPASLVRRWRGELAGMLAGAAGR